MVLGLGLLQVQGSYRCQLSVPLIELEALVPACELGQTEAWTRRQQWAGLLALVQIHGSRKAAPKEG